MDNGKKIEDFLKEKRVIFEELNGGWLEDLRVSDGERREGEK